MNLGRLLVAAKTGVSNTTMNSKSVVLDSKSRRHPFQISRTSLYQIRQPSISESVSSL